MKPRKGLLKEVGELFDFAISYAGEGDPDTQDLREPVFKALKKETIEALQALVAQRRVEDARGKLEALSPVVDAEIVENLRELLVAAEKGEVQHIAIASCDARGIWTSTMVGKRDALVAGLERIKFRILQSWESR